MMPYLFLPATLKMNCLLSVPASFSLAIVKKLFADRVRRQLAGENINDSVEFQVRKKDGSVMHIILNISFHEITPILLL